MKEIKAADIKQNMPATKENGRGTGGKTDTSPLADNPATIHFLTTLGELFPFFTYIFIRQLYMV